MSGVFREEAGYAPDDSADGRTPPGALLLVQQVVVIGHLILILIAANLDGEKAGLEIDRVHEIRIQRREKGFAASTGSSHTQPETGCQGTQVIATTGTT